MRYGAGGSLGAGAALALTVSPALAHDAFGNAGAFWGGFLHPLTALEHVLAIIAFGLLAGLQPPRPVFAALLTLALALAVGGIAGMAGWLPPDLGLAAAGSIAVVALLVAVARPLPPPVLIALALVLGLLHGAANGAAVPVGADRIAFLLGLVAGPTLLAHLLGGAVRHLEAPWVRVAVRVLGSWLTAVGLLVLGRFVLTPSAVAG